MKKGKIDNTGFFIQCVLLSAAIISMITIIFIGPLYVVTDALIALLLLTLCYNNYKFYKRKYLTIIYFLVGVAWLILTIVEVLHGV